MDLTPARAAQAQASTTTVGQWLETFHDGLQRRPKPVRPSTLTKYREAFRNRITAPLPPGDTDPDVTTLATTPLVKLTKAGVYRWWDGMQRTYPNHPVQNQNAYKRLKAACADAVRREMIPTNPVGIPEAGKRVKPDEKYLPSDAELQAILEHMRPEYRVLTSLTLFHGLRIGEALALERRHVSVVEDPAAPGGVRVTVTVEQNAQRVTDEDGHTVMELHPPKSEAGYRSVVILAPHAPMFVEHLERYAPTTSTVVRAWHAGAISAREVQLLTATGRGGDGDGYVVSVDLEADGGACWGDDGDYAALWAELVDHASC